MIQNFGDPGETTSQPPSNPAAARRTLHHSPSAPEFASAGQEKTGPSSSRSTGLHGRTTSRQQRSVTPDAPRRHPVRAAAEQEVSASLRVPSSGKHVPKLEREAPVHIRLYQEKDDRRRRLEQARLRRLEQEEEDLRMAAERALGRQPSPARPRRDPSPGKMLLGPSPSGGPSSVGRTDSPARRARPPIPDRLKQRSFPGFLEWGSWFHVRCHLTLLYWLHVIQTRNP
eukprot:s6873_g1.t2